jgi:hypothetical protein
MLSILRGFGLGEILGNNQTIINERNVVMITPFKDDEIISTPMDTVIWYLNDSAEFWQEQIILWKNVDNCLLMSAIAHKNCAIDAIDLILRTCFCSGWR